MASLEFVNRSTQRKYTPPDPKPTEIMVEFRVTTKKKQKHQKPRGFRMGTGLTKAKPVPPPDSTWLQVVNQQRKPPQKQQETGQGSRDGHNSSL